MSAHLPDDMADWAQRSVLCWLATVDENGQPHVSPKEIFAVVDTQRIAVAHLASPGTVRNVRATGKVCLSMIDVLAQKGLKILGSAVYVPPSAPTFEALSAPLRRMAGPRFPIHGVVLVTAHAVEPILAPSYRLFPQDTTEASQIAQARRRYGLDHPASL